MTLADIPNVISSPGLEVGRLPWNLQDGLQLDLFGPDLVPASRSALPAKEKALTTIVTSGPIYESSLRSQSLQSSLENRLRQRMAVIGSLEYDLTWKHWGMQSGPPICALRALKRKAPFYYLGVTDSGRPLLTLDPLICASVCSGWPTPTSSMVTEQDLAQAATAGNGAARKPYAESRMFLVGWNTPRASDGSNGGPNQANGALTPDAHMAMAGWPTAAAQNAQGGPNPRGNVGEHFTLQTAAVMAGYPTPNTCPDAPNMSRARENGRIAERGTLQSLTAVAREMTGPQILAGWVTPSTRDYKDTPGMSLTGTNPDGSERTRIDQLPRQAAIAGQISLSSLAATEKRGVLNPELPRWLMGYPEGWGSYADTETRFIRK